MVWHMDSVMPEWLTFPENVATILAQIIPVLFLAAILELRQPRKKRSDRPEWRAYRRGMTALFLELITSEVALIVVIWSGGVTGDAAFFAWAMTLIASGFLLSTLWTVVVGDEKRPQPTA